MLFLKNFAIDIPTTRKFPWNEKTDAGNVIVTAPTMAIDCWRITMISGLSDERKYL
jgi:hypothetical protein